MPGVQVFSDKAFFILQRVPSRSTYIERIEHNGGRLVKLEAQADYVIADHLRKDAPYGSQSYKFVDDAITTGEIPDLEKHKIGGATSTAPASSRPVGGLSAPVKGTRTPFSTADDHELWNWVKRHEAIGAAVRGNEIYKELERRNPRHTFQSWRDRYIKVLINRPPTGVAPTGPPTPPSDNAPSTPVVRPQPTSRSTRPQVPRTARRPSSNARPSYGEDYTDERDNDVVPGSKYPKGFTEGELEMLMDEAEDIERIAYGDLDKAWEAYAAEHGRHTAEEWAEFHVKCVRPEWKRRKAVKEQARRSLLDDRDSEGIDQLDGAAGSSLRRAVGMDEPVQAPPPASVSKPAFRRPPRRNSQDLYSSPPQQVQKMVRPQVVAAVKKETSAAPPKPTSPLQSETIIRKRPLDIEDTEAVKRKKLVPEQIPKSTPDAVVDKRTTFVNPQQGESGEDHVAPPALVSQLTEENLSQMQAQHRAARTSRGKDLAEDDEDDNQEHYADYLQSLLQPPQPKPAAGPLAAPLAALRQSSQPRQVASSQPRSNQTFRRRAAKADVIEIPESVEGRSDEEEEEDQDDVSLPSQILGSSPPQVRRKPQVQLPQDDSDVEVPVSARSKAVQHKARQQSAARPQAAPAVRTSGSRNAFAQAGSTAHRLAFPQSDERPSEAKMTSSPPPLISSSDSPGLDGNADDEGDRTLIQLDLAAPEGGWYEHLSSQSSDHPLPSIENARTAAIETQAVFDNVDLDADFDLPQYDNPIRESSIEVGRGTNGRLSNFREDVRSVTPIASSGDDVSEYIEAKKRAGFKDNDIDDALFACSMQLELSEVALKVLSKGRGLPKTITGVWTLQEDADLQSGSAGKIERLNSKHGPREVNRRLQFLNAING
ncbi:Hypothetical protein D9617_38g090970 [Elsinoe fawcettii]|nr:Hypothetical protein D9617_38g090970 [Elsinoe fawcettii]